MATDHPDMHIVHRGKAKRTSEQDSKLLKRRQAMAPIIGHLKIDSRMERCHLKGDYGDRLTAPPLHLPGAGLAFEPDCHGLNAATSFERVTSRSSCWGA